MEPSEPADDIVASPRFKLARYEPPAFQAFPQALTKSDPPSDAMSVSGEIEPRTLKRKRSRSVDDSGATTPTTSTASPSCNSAPQPPAERPPQSSHKKSKIDKDFLHVKVGPDELPERILLHDESTNKTAGLFNELEERFFVNSFYSQVNATLNRLHFDNMNERAKAYEQNKMVVDEPDI